MSLHSKFQHLILNVAWYRPKSHFSNHKIDYENFFLLFLFYKIINAAQTKTIFKRRLELNSRVFRLKTEIHLHID